MLPRCEEGGRWPEFVPYRLIASPKCADLVMWWDGALLCDFVLWRSQCGRVMAAVVGYMVKFMVSFRRLQKNHLKNRCLGR
jgi:hypothetical protein